MLVKGATGDVVPVIVARGNDQESDKVMAYNSPDQPHPDSGRWEKPPFSLYEKGHTPHFM